MTYLAEKSKQLVAAAGPLSHMDTIRRAARRYSGPDLPTEELVQEGAIMFYTALEQWDPARMHSWRAYLYYRCVGRFAYIKHSLYREAGRMDGGAGVEMVPAGAGGDPERCARLRKALGRLSEDAQRVVALVLNPPPLLIGRLNRHGLRQYLSRHRFSDPHRITRAFREITTALAGV